MFQSNCKENVKSLREDIERHEENLKLLRREADRLDESILDLQVSLVKCHSPSVPKETNLDRGSYTEEETRKQILQQRNSAAGILCQVKTHLAIQASNLSWAKEVLGVVATLARVENDNVSRLLSEYLGPEAMLGIVCNTIEGVRALEKYDGEGNINGSTGLHGLGSSIGRKINGRFLVICLEELRPYVGGFMANDVQKKLALPTPQLPNGKCPSGFIDFAVNMVNLDDDNLSYITSDGNGLRETLFYNLFSRLHVYTSRTEMLLALPCVTHGAISLDGGMIRRNGFFAFGNRKDVDVKFPLISGGSELPSNFNQMDDRIKILKRERHSIAQDIEREQQLLSKTKANFMSQAGGTQFPGEKRAANSGVG